MIIPELSKLQVVYDDWGEEFDDFYVELEAYIIKRGEKNLFAYELFKFNIVSPKRLSKFVENNYEIEIGRGYLITNDYSLSIIESKIKHLLTNCKRENWDEVIHAINRYGKWADES